MCIIKSIWVWDATFGLVHWFPAAGWLAVWLLVMIFVDFSLLFFSLSSFFLVLENNVLLLNSHKILFEIVIRTFFQLLNLRLLITNEFIHQSISCRFLLNNSFHFLCFPYSAIRKSFKSQIFFLPFFPLSFIWKRRKILFSDGLSLAQFHFLLKKRTTS